MNPNLTVEKNRAIWDRFIQDNQRKVREMSVPAIADQSDHSIVIIEPRCHPHLEFVLKTALFFLGGNWSVDIFASRLNYKFVKKITADLGPARIYLLDVDNLTDNQYNSIKKSPDFWRYLLAENILWLEPDCLICRPGIDAFLGYDFIGAPWHPAIAASPGCRVGNGGLSFRKRSAMIKVAENANVDNNVILTEDLFFATNMHMANQLNPDTFTLPTTEIARTFSVESVFYPEPLGMHKSWRYLQHHDLEDIISKIKI